MNCTQIEELLPLYVSADLAAHETERVRQHLAACASCRESAAAWAESQAWLQTAPLPNFSEDFLAGIRASVQAEIVTLKAKPNWWQRLTLGLAWRPLVAVSCLLLVILGWALYRQLNQPLGQTPREIADGKETQPQLAAPQVLPDTNHVAQTGNPNGASAPKGTQPERRSKGRKLPTPGPVQLKEQLRNDLAANLAAGTTGSQPAGPADALAEPEMTRIEFQTADPNIRIIWFAPKLTGTTDTKAEPNSR
jgi:hypothetical protein